LTNTPVMTNAKARGSISEEHPPCFEGSSKISYCKALSLTRPDGPRNHQGQVSSRDLGRHRPSGKGNTRRHRNTALGARASRPRLSFPNTAGAVAFISGPIHGLFPPAPAEVMPSNPARLYPNAASGALSARVSQKSIGGLLTSHADWPSPCQLDAVGVFGALIA